MNSGLFITVEGIEGVGKTTNIQFIADWLTAKQIPFITTREPGGTPLAEEIREVLLSPREEPVDDTTELLLMFAARAQHLAALIKPTIAKGHWVLCDRFTDATYAYQGGGRGLPMATIAQLEQLVQQSFRPDAVILLDVPAEVGLRRAGKRGALDRIEKEQASFFDKVRQCYLARAQQSPQIYHVVDASQDLAGVQRQLAQVLTLIHERYSSAG